MVIRDSPERLEIARSRSTKILILAQQTGSVSLAVSDVGVVDQNLRWDLIIQALIFNFFRL